MSEPFYKLEVITFKRPLDHVKYGRRLMGKKPVIEIKIHFKEKNCSPEDYNTVAWAWLKSQKMFKDTLTNLEASDRLSTEICIKLIKEFRLIDIDDRLEKFKLKGV